MLSLYKKLKCLHWEKLFLYVRVQMILIKFVISITIKDLDFILSLDNQNFTCVRYEVSLVPRDNTHKSTEVFV